MVRKLGEALVYSLLLVVILFGLNLLTFRFEYGEEASALFSVNAAIATICVSNLWFRNKESDFLRDGCLLGILWFFLGAGFFGPIIAISSGFLLQNKLSGQKSGGQKEPGSP